MIVPAGYQATEIGIIPDDWEAVPLGRLGSFSKGQGIRKDQASSGDVPCVRYGEIYTDHNDVVRKYRSRISREVASTSKVLRKGDLLFAGSGETKEEIGKCVAFVDDCEAYAGGDIIILSPRSANSVLLGYLLNSEVIARQKAARAQGDAVVHISAKALADVIAPLPTSDIEQSAIAEALSDMDEAIVAQEAVIAKKRALRTATMQALLSGTRRLPGFSREWEEKALDKVCPMQRGFDLPTKQIRPGKVPVVYSNGISAHHDKAMVKGPGIVTGRSGTIGNVHFVEDDFWPHNTSLWVTSMCGNDARFLVYFLRRLNLSNFSSGSGVPTLNRNDFHSHRVKIPEPAEQTAITDVLFDMDLDLANSEKGLAKLKVLKVGMMQQILTGQIRLV